jgi:hypothetical protein
MRKLPIAACLVLLAGPALAQVNFQTSVKGYHYFHKTGATMQAHDEAVKNCVRLVNGLWLDNGSGYGLVGSVLDGMHTELAVPANVEHCMVAFGWEVMQIDEARGKALAAGSREARHEALAQWVGSPAPEGRMARRFVNDITDPATVWDGRSWGSDKPSLSITSQAPFNEKPGPYTLPKFPNTAFPPQSLNARQIAALPSDASVIVVRATLAEAKGFRTMVFNRAGPDGYQPAWADGQPAAFRFSTPPLMSNRDKTYVFRVPPGKWRLAGLSSAYGFTSFCYGAPAFEVKPGEAVFAGTFSAGHPGQLVPVMDLAPMTGALKDAPALLARLKPATWVNGSWERCSGAYAYAFEIPGAPFEEGYTGGSKALAPAP